MHNIIRLSYPLTMTLAEACNKAQQIERLEWFKKMKLKDERVISFTDEKIAIIRRTKTTHSIDIRAKHTTWEK